MAAHRDLTPSAVLTPPDPTRNGKAPIPPRRLPSDDYVVTVDGVEYRPHAGEWLEVGSTRTLRQMKALEDATTAVEGEDSATYFGRLWAAMTVSDVYLRGWSWTGPDGGPLPTPDSPGVWLDLTDDEVLYVVQRVLGGVEGAAPFAERLRGYAAWLMDLGPQPYDLLLDALAQRWGCRPSEVEEEDVERVDRILEGAYVERVFRTPGNQLKERDRAFLDLLMSHAPPAAEPRPEPGVVQKEAAAFAGGVHAEGHAVEAREGKR